MIRVLVVEDSPVARELLIHILTSDPAIRVIGAAANGREALEAAAAKRPDLITMDIHMPVMDGLESTRRIMETYPIPIVIVTASMDPREVEKSFRAVEAGALAVVSKPVGLRHPNYEKAARELVLTVKLMAEVKVVKRWAKASGEKPAGVFPNEGGFARPEGPAPPQIVAVGASTGGPVVLQAILAELPRHFPVPVLIVQHMAPGFIGGFAAWLERATGFPVSLAEDGAAPLPGNAYVAPDGVQMEVGSGRRIKLAPENPPAGLCPSVSCLFRSVNRVFGKNAVGVLLSGMGRDGAEELKAMKETGAVTIVQDRPSAVVYGMPGEAVHLDAARHILSPEEIARMLTKLVL